MLCGVLYQIASWLALSSPAAVAAPVPGPALTEGTAVALVVELGGTVTRDEKRAGKPIVGVSLSNTKVTDADLKELARLTELSSLGLSCTNVTDMGLKELPALPKLTRLYLSETKVTDAGMKELSTLKNLATL